VAGATRAGRRRPIPAAALRAYFRGRLASTLMFQGEVRTSWHTRLRRFRQKSLECTMLGLCRRACALPERALWVLVGGVAANCSMTGHCFDPHFATRVRPPFPMTQGSRLLSSVHVAPASTGACRKCHPADHGGARACRAGPSCPCSSTTPRFSANWNLRPAAPRPRFDRRRERRVLVSHGRAPESPSKLWAAGRFLPTPGSGERQIEHQLKGREIWRTLAPSVHETAGSSFDCPLRPHAVHTFMPRGDPCCRAWRAAFPHRAHRLTRSFRRIVRISSLPQPSICRLNQGFSGLTRVPRS